MEINIYLVVIVTILTLLWCYGTHINGHFTRHGLKNLPSWPFFGNSLKVTLRMEHFKDVFGKLYNGFREQKYVGFYQYFKRVIIINDLDLIKQISVKDFDHFTDHYLGIGETADPLFGNNLFSMKGQKWRDMRATLSPAFTSAKMRNMFELVADCAENMTHFYMKEVEKKKGTIEVEMKDDFTRYTNDVIATTAFGIKVDSHFERNNEFYKMGWESSNFTGFRVVKFFMFNLSTTFCKIMGWKLFDERMSNFFRSLVANSMKLREEGKEYRPDMIQLLMEAKKGSLKHDKPAVDMKETGFATVEESALGKQVVKREWSDDEITAQAVLFFIAGFDTTATLLCFVAHEMATHPEIQAKLQEEIDKVAANNNGKLNYDDLQNMKYLDMVVSETLRMWPPVFATDRRCTKPYTLPPLCEFGQQTGYKINMGEGVCFPIYSIHHDPEYYPYPEKFDPERFSDDNKGSIQQLTFIPFGIGPRNCIGSRFALMETKAVIFHILAKFNMTVISKTSIPMKISNNSFNLHAEKGFWVGLKLRE